MNLLLILTKKRKIASVFKQIKEIKVRMLNERDLNIIWLKENKINEPLLNSAGII